LVETEARRGPYDAPAQRGRRRIADGASFVALVAVVLSVTWVYVASERTFYFWDHAEYHDIATRTAAAFRESTGRGIAFLQESYRGDYNALFALPLVPWLLAFGESRLAFEVSLALVYLVPLSLAIGALAVRLVPGGGRAAFWLAVGATLLVPMAWVPTFRGYPDSGAAALVVLAMLVFLEDDRLREPRTLVYLGGLLGLAVVFRRHFAYAATAFLLSIAVDALLERRGAGSSRPRTPGVAGLGLRLLAVAGIALATGVVTAASSVRRMLVLDYSSLYRSYEQPLGVLTTYFVGCYGWATLLLACAGFAVAALSPGVGRRRARFVLLFCGLSWVQWSLVVRQVGVQYTLHFTPTIVLGLCLLLFAPLPGRWSGLRPSAVVLVLGSSVANLYLGLWGPATPVPRSLQPLVVRGWTPLVRSDYSEIVALVRALRADTGPGPAAFVVSSSTCLNASIVSAADRGVPGGMGRLDVLPVPSVDSNGYYPLNELLAAGQVVLARPFQPHLAPDQQVVLRTVYDTFAAGVGIARDFSESPRVFRLDGCTVSLFERRRPTGPTTALGMLRAFEERVPERPGLQPDWVTIDRRFPTRVIRRPDGSTTLVAHPSPRGATPSTAFTLLDVLAGPASIEGTVRFVDARCEGAALRLWAMDGGGVRRPLQEVRRRPEDDGRFSVRVAPRPGERLFLDIVEHDEGASIDYCLLTIDPLVVARDAPAP
jgi:hypothetical protein